MEKISLKPVELDIETLAAIGKLVRVAAEIEDLVTLAIGDFAGLGEGGTGLLLGRSSISARVNILDAFAKIHERQAEPVFKWLCGVNFTRLLACRNLVAHGTLLGQDEEGNFTFQTTRFTEPEDGNPVRLMDAYSKESIIEIAEVGSGAISKIERDLKLEQRRAERTTQQVRLHPVDQKQPKRRKKPKPPPRA